MSAELIVKTEVPPVSWEDFTENYPAGSIALDGYVADGPLYDESGPFLNANHHERVDRLATLSTAQQLLMLARMGIDKAFSDDGEFSPKVFVNDCDQDVCTAWFLLHHIEQAKNPSNPALNRFVQVAGTLDATSGMFPFDPNLEILGEQAWVFEPYTQFRASGEMAKKDNRQYRTVIDSVESRIQRHLMGRGERVSLDTKYNTISKSSGWSMIEEVGKDGRVGAFMDGIDAYVSVQELSEGHWRYTVGRRSLFVQFDLPNIFDALNQEEALGGDNQWGGSDIIGGSPRVGDSTLPPDRVRQIIDDILNSKQ